jgi:hypothetical protein
MDPQTLIYIGFGLWILILSIGFLWVFVFFRKLSKKTKAGDLTKLITQLIETEKQNKIKLENLGKDISNIREEARGHLQKVHMTRFNPFNELGGEQSFSTVILDGKDNGIVLTGLHTRQVTRLYAKSINKGKSELELSKEEKQVLNKAVNS